MNLRVFICGFAATALLALIAQGQALGAESTTHQIDGSALDAAIEASLKANGTPSASVAIVQDGHIAYAKAFGQAALWPHVAATPATRYQIASVSKEIVAAGALLLQEDGKLSLDDHVSKWFPDLTSADTITLRQLLSHTSGYSDFWPQDYVMLTMSKPTTPQAIINTWAKAPLDYKPGDAWQYSNTGYVVAGLIVEKVSGQPLFSFLNARILKPVGITDAVDVSTTDLVLPDALGYESRALAPNRPTTLAGKGWFYSAATLGLTAEDVAKWDLSLLKKSLLKPESYVVETQTIKLNSGRDSGYAMGLFVSKADGHTLFEHSGEGAGYISENRIYPDDGLAIVVLTNSMSGGAASEIADRIAFAALPAQGLDAHVQTLFEALQAGKVDRRDFTENFNQYLTAETLNDYKTSLGPLGKPTFFRLAGSNLRGGMEFRFYRIRAGGRALNLSVYLTKDGKIEQFLVSEAT